MIEILHDLKETLRTLNYENLWYSPSYGSCRMYIINCKGYLFGRAVQLGFRVLGVRGIYVGALLGGSWSCTSGTAIWPYGHEGVAENTGTSTLH